MFPFSTGPERERKKIHIDGRVGRCNQVEALPTRHEEELGGVSGKTRCLLLLTVFNVQPTAQQFRTAPKQK